MKITKPTPDLNSGITPAEGNVFVDLGFPAEEAAALLVDADARIARAAQLKEEVSVAARPNVQTEAAFFDSVRAEVQARKDGLRTTPVVLASIQPDDELQPPEQTRHVAITAEENAFLSGITTSGEFTLEKVSGMYAGVTRLRG